MEGARGNETDCGNEKTLRKKRGIAKGRFTTKVRVFQNCKEKNEPVEVLGAVFIEICEIFKEVEIINESLLQIVDDDEHISEHLDYICDLEKVKCDVHSTLVSLKNESQKPPQKADNSCSILVKKVDPPIFDGNVREFPTFIKDYTRLVIAHHGKDPFILRRSLQGKAREVIGGLDEFEQMWDRLRERFGSTSKVVDAVLGEISVLRPVPEGNTQKLLEVINIVEQAWLDLKKINRVNEIENSATVTKIERLLPNSLKREWTHKAQGLGDQERFEQLVKFLTGERQVIEYMEDESRLTKVGTKATSNYITTNEGDETVDNLTVAITKLAQNQEVCQRQILDCFANLSQAMINLANKNQFDNETMNPNLSNKINAKRCWFHGTDSHDIGQCVTFGNLDDTLKFDNLKKMGICFVCLEPSHISRDCNKKIPCNIKVGNRTCGKLHHPSLHSLFNKSLLTVKASSNFMEREGVLLMISKIKSGSHTLSTLFDAGSNLTMITHTAAKKLGLKGSEVCLSLTKVGNQKERIDSKIYKVPLIDDNGKQWLVEAIGFDDITSEIQDMDMTKFASVLGIHPSQIQRPSGKIDLLIGSDYCILIPKVIKTVGNLQLLYNDFGYCIRGHLGPLAHNYDEFHANVNHLARIQSDEYLVKPKIEIGKMMECFFMNEELGISCSPKCGGCRCGKCSLRGLMTLKEERELKLIEDGLDYDEQKRCWVADYPWTKDPSDLPNNISLAEARLRSTERRLNKLGLEYSQRYNEQIKDMVERGVARKMTDDEILSYKGPVFYLPHHEVHKSDSKSTPMRIVFDSSAPYMGYTLNDFLAKRPDCLNNILGILLRFRQGLIGLIGDIKKMYNSVKISYLDQNCHRFLWRENTECSPDHYALTTVTFGDKPGGAIAMVALRKTAEMCKDYPMATKLIERDSYVDDLLVSVDCYDVAETIMTEIDHVLSKGGFQIKHWVSSGVFNSLNAHPGIIETDTEKVLGLNWNPKSDYFFFVVHLNFSKKIRKLCTSPDITRERFENEMPQKLSKRMIVSQVSSIYDPMGLIAPFTLKAKLLMRELILDLGISNKKLGWDDTVSSHSYDEWKILFREMFELEPLRFGRCLRPHNSIGNPHLIIFADGSLKAYGAVAYFRWELSDGSFSSHLIASKCKLAPVRQMTIPRIELCGAVLACRLRAFIEQEMDFKCESVTHIVDSEIVRSQIQKESFRFNTFVANRVSEIQDKTEPTEWYWIASELNIADLLTRGCKPELLNESSLWQSGPEFLSLPRIEWPIKQKYLVDLPDVLFLKAGKSSFVIVNDDSIIDIKEYNDYNKLINVTARVLNVFIKGSLFHLGKVPNAEDLQRAEIYWIKKVQESIHEDWKTRYQRLGPKQNSEGIITVGARLSKWLKTSWNREDYILLMADHPFTKLIIKDFHERDHSGIETTLVKLQTKFWVPGARRIIKQIKAKCVMCRRINKICESQSMGQLPKERLNPSPPFYYTSLDLFGPYLVKDAVKKRTTLKVYGVIFACMSSRAVHIDIATGYDTENFINVFRRFISIRGFPKMVYSDRGSQLVKANKELTQAIGNLNFDNIRNFGRKEGMIWKFTKAADAPWQNGCTESLIRLVKRGISMSIGERILPYADLQTVMFEIANLINQRPIGIKPGSDLNLGSYLCPNDLLLGRASPNVPTGVFEDNHCFRKRFKHVNEIVDVFWKRWMRDFFPTLLVRTKWHVEKRNVKAGDIVLVKDTNALKGNWKLAQVKSASPSFDGRVRNVTLRLKPSLPGVKYQGQKDILIDRSVHNIVVILPIEEQ